MAARGGSSRQSAVKAKVVLLGEGAVGKTSIVLRYFENKFNDKHEQTLQVGVEYEDAILMLCGGCFEPNQLCTSCIIRYFNSSTIRLL